MKILLVIHGYPPYYMAGSEVYTYNLAHELVKEHDVYVFTRIEDKSIDLYKTFDSIEDQIHIRRINNYEPTDALFTDKYLNTHVDDSFRKYVEEVQPDIVHIGHLSHLSTQLPIIAKREYGLPVLFTIHDFWMFCHRGQLINPQTMKICELPNTEQCHKCACSHYKNPDFKMEWIKHRESFIKTVIDCIDIFFAPSHTLEQFYLDMGVEREKIFYSKYGFDIGHIQPIKKEKHEPIRFGFMGRIIYTKGVHLLLSAFSKTNGNAKLVVWGDADSEYGKELSRQYANNPRIEFRGAFHTNKLQETLNSFDVLCCPSIWLENAPLVIQEAQAAHIPIITSNRGGMAELVHDEVDGFLFELGNEESLQTVLQRIIDNPELLNNLSPSIEKVRNIKEDADFCVQKYKQLQQTEIKYPHRPAPWRVTFVTNPDRCNLHCKMCDTFSPFHTPKSKETHRAEMPIELIEKVLNQLVPHGLREIIPSTMGEPLMYSHFEEFVDLCHYHKIKTNLTTNGTFPTKIPMEEMVNKLLPVISDVKFSLNGINPAVNEFIMGGAKTEKQLSNIRYWIKRRDELGLTGKSTVTLQITFMKSNLHELTNLIQWGIDNKVDRIKGHHVWVTYKEIEDESLYRTEYIDEWNSVVKQCHAMAQGKINLVNFNPISSENRNTENTYCPFLGRELWIEHDGSYQICCCPSEIRKDFGDFGNINELEPMSMWNSTMYSDFIKQWGEHKNCKQCNMRTQR